jgi:hypothetical protein
MLLKWLRTAINWKVAATAAVPLESGALLGVAGAHTNKKFGNDVFHS